MSRVVVVGLDGRLRDVSPQPLLVVGPQTDPDRLARQIGRLRNGFLLALTDDDLRARNRVRLREIVFLEALGRDRHLIHDDVVASRVQTGQDAVPLGRDELRLDAEALGERVGEVDFEADEIAVGFLIVERGIGAFQRDAQRPARFYLREQPLVGGSRRSRSGAENERQAEREQIETC